MDKYDQLQAVHDAVEEGIHSSDAQEELVWREVAAVYGDEQDLKATVDAVYRLIRAGLKAAKTLEGIK
jgi:hypothetical protein